MARVEKSTDEENQTIHDIISYLDVLDTVQLDQVIRAAQEQRTAKLQKAREAFIARVREEAAALDLRPEDLFAPPAPARKPSGGTRRRGKVPAQFVGPDGQTWSGRGRVPRWLTSLEAQGRNREEFRIKEGQPDLIEQAERKHKAS